MRYICQKIIVILIILIFKPSIASEIVKVKNIKNKVFVLDIYGERYSIIKNSRIKSGDFLKSTKKSAILFLKNSKICFSKNSSIKINSINQATKKINITIVKGKFVFYKNKINKLKFFLKLNNNIIQNQFGYVFLSKTLNNSISIKTFKGENYLYNKSNERIKLNSNSFYHFQENIETNQQKDNFKHSDFLKQCYNKNYKSYLPNEFKYKCSSSKNKIYCGYQ